jgi:hypothetical protein
MENTGTRRTYRDSIDCTFCGYLLLSKLVIHNIMEGFGTR